MSTTAAAVAGAAATAAVVSSSPTSVAVPLTSGVGGVASLPAIADHARHGFALLLSALQLEDSLTGNTYTVELAMQLARYDSHLTTTERRAFVGAFNALLYRLLRDHRKLAERRAALQQGREALDAAAERLQLLIAQERLAGPRGQPPPRIHTSATRRSAGAAAGPATTTAASMSPMPPSGDGPGPFSWTGSGGGSFAGLRGALMPALDGTIWTQSLVAEVLSVIDGGAAGVAPPPSQPHAPALPRREGSQPAAPPPPPVSLDDSSRRFIDAESPQSGDDVARFGDNMSTATLLGSVEVGGTDSFQSESQPYALPPMLSSFAVADANGGGAPLQLGDLVELAGGLAAAAGTSSAANTTAPTSYHSNSHGVTGNGQDSEEGIVESASLLDRGVVSIATLVEMLVSCPARRTSSLNSPCNSLEDWGAAYATDGSLDGAVSEGSFCGMPLASPAGATPAPTTAYTGRLSMTHDAIAVLRVVFPTMRCSSHVFDACAAVKQSWMESSLPEALLDGEEWKLDSHSGPPLLDGRRRPAVARQVPPRRRSRPPAVAAESSPVPGPRRRRQKSLSFISVGHHGGKGADDLVPLTVEDVLMHAVATAMRRIHDGGIPLQPLASSPPPESIADPRISSEVMLSTLHVVLREMSGGVAAAAATLASMQDQIREELLLLIFRTVITILDLLLPATTLMEKRTGIFYRKWVCDLYRILLEEQLLEAFNRLLSAMRMEPGASSATPPATQPSAPASRPAAAGGVEEWPRDEPAGDARGPGTAADRAEAIVVPGSLFPHEGARSPVWSAAATNSNSSFQSGTLRATDGGGSAGGGSAVLPLRRSTSGVAAGAAGVGVGGGGSSAGSPSSRLIDPSAGIVATLFTESSVGGLPLRLMGTRLAYGLLRGIHAKELNLIVPWASDDGSSSALGSPRATAPTADGPQDTQVPLERKNTLPPGSAYATPGPVDRGGKASGAAARGKAGSDAAGAREKGTRAKQPAAGAAGTSAAGGAAGGSGGAPRQRNMRLRSEGALAMPHHHSFRYPVVHSADDVVAMYHGVLASADVLLSPHDPIRAAVVNNTVDFLSSAMGLPADGHRLLRSYLADVATEAVHAPVRKQAFLLPAGTAGDYTMGVAVAAAAAAAATAAHAGGLAPTGSPPPVPPTTAAGSAFSVTNLSRGAGGATAAGDPTRWQLERRAATPPRSAYAARGGAGRPAGGSGSPCSGAPGASSLDGEGLVSCVVPDNIPSWAAREEQEQFYEILSHLVATAERLRQLLGLDSGEDEADDYDANGDDGYDHSIGITTALSNTAAAAAVQP